MKSRPLSILPSDPDLPDATDQNSAADKSANSQPALANHRARYYAYLNQQIHQPERRSNSLSSAVRFAQGLLSLAIFVAMFLTILTLFGFGLSRLGVIAQVSPNGASASAKQNDSPVNHSPSNSAPTKRTRGK